MYQCEFCTLQTKRKHNLKIHMLRKHKNQCISKNEMCSNRIPVIENKTIQEANQIDHVHHHEPLPSVQHGSGVVSEQDNQAYNKVVEIANGWKNVCEKLQEEKLAKDNAIKIRDAHLFNQNNKIQEEFNKNKNLHLENQNLRMNNTNIHGDYYNALEKIEHLELMNEDISKDRDEKIGAMGKDMGKVIHRYKRLKRKYRRRNIDPSPNFLQIGNGIKHREFMQYLKNKYRGRNGLKKETLAKADKDRLVAPTTVSVRNNGQVHWRGEEGYQSGSGIFRCGGILHRNRGIGGMLRSIY